MSDGLDKLTPDEFDRMRQDHVARPAFEGRPGELECTTCIDYTDSDGISIHATWPCDAAYLLARVRALEAALKASLRWDGHIRGCPMPYGRDCFDSCKNVQAALAGKESA